MGASVSTTILTILTLVLATVSNRLVLILAFNVAFILDITANAGLALLCAGLVGPNVDHSDDLSQVGRLAEAWRERLAFLNVRRIAFRGSILTESGHNCIASFPGKYPDFWDAVTSLTRVSVACVFLTDAASGLGQHAVDPESAEGACYCHQIYGSIKPHAYICRISCRRRDEDETDYLQRRGLKIADARIMNQIIVDEAAIPTDILNAALADALVQAAERAQRDRFLAPWGCQWFASWASNIELAHSRNQRLQVYYFEGQVGKGEVDWDDLSSHDPWDGVGLGGSQKAEVAYLKKRGYAFDRIDVASLWNRRSLQDGTSLMDLPAEVIGSSNAPILTGVMPCSLPGSVSEA